MNVTTLFVSAGISFVAFAAIFRPLEWVFPAKHGQRFFRPAWGTDLCFFLGQYLLWTGTVFWLLSRFSRWLSEIVPSSFRDGIAAQPWWLQVAEVIVLSDFLVYWAHRLQHRVQAIAKLEQKERTHITDRKSRQSRQHRILDSISY